MPERKISLSLKDLSLLFDENIDDISEEATAALLAMISEDPQMSAQLAELREMAQDAGTDWLEDGLETHRQFEKLLAADSWDALLEIVKDEAERVWYEKLIPMARARAQRAEDPDRILSLKKRLVEAAAQEELGLARNQAFCEELKKLDPDIAEGMLERLMEEVRHRRKASEVPDPSSPT